MNFLLRSYRLLNVLSLDVVGGSVCSALFFLHLSENKSNLIVLLVLGLCVWIIYTSDHLMDARNIKVTATSFRHRFHQIHYNRLLKMVILTGIIAAALVLWLPPMIIKAGVLVSVVVLFYLLIHRKLKLFKEFVIAVLYTTGVLIPSITGPTFWENINPVVVITFVVTAFSNLLVFSWYDAEADHKDNLISLSLVMGVERMRKFVISLVLVNMLLMVFYLYGETLLILFIMNAVLLSIIMLPQYFRVGERYRMVGDAVFYLPVVILL